MQSATPKTFEAHLSAVHSRFEALKQSSPVRFPFGQLQIPKAGVYLFSEADDHLYAGRSDDIRERLGMHQRPSSGVGQASFACRIAKEACGIKKVSYKPSGPGEHYSEREDFGKAFTQAKERIRKMDVRWIEESDPVTQALLEIFAAVTLPTRYNDFSNH